MIGVRTILSAPGAGKNGTTRINITFRTRKRPISASSITKLEYANDTITNPVKNNIMAILMEESPWIGALMCLGLLFTN